MLFTYIGDNSHGEFPNLLVFGVIVEVLNGHEFYLDLKVLLDGVAFPRGRGVELWIVNLIIIHGVFLVDQSR